MSTKENKELIERLFAERSSVKGDASQVRAVWEKYNVPTYVRHNVSMDLNLEQQIQHAIALWAGFPDLINRPDAMVAEGDEVWVRYTARGTHTGPFRGIAPTGRRVVIKGIEIHRIVQGKIVEAWSYVDASWVNQLGTTPPAP
jgi:predicted ester cyclase